MLEEEGKPRTEREEMSNLYTLKLCECVISGSSCIWRWDLAEFRSNLTFTEFERKIGIEVLIERRSGLVGPFL